MFFYFALKALFVLEIFQILFWVFGLVGKRLDKEAKSTLKTYNITKWITNNYNTHTHMHVTHTTKFSQLVENNMRNVVEKPYVQNVTEKLVLDPFLKNPNWADLWIKSLKFHTGCCIVCPSRVLPKHVETSFYFV